MNEQGLTRHPKKIFVAHLQDLIKGDDYLDPSRHQKLHIQISITDEGVDILGDSRHVLLLEELLAQISVDDIEQMLCG